jgi:hypothetical protein
MSAVTATTMTISWNAPSDDGGCPIQSYAIYQKGAGDANFV